MPDLLTGTPVSPDDTPPSVSDAENGSYTTTTSSGFNVNGTGYPGDCGVAFRAPTTGRVVIHYAAQMANSSTGNTIVAPAVRTGASVGAGSDVVAASDAESIFNRNTDVRRYGAHTFVSGLDPGVTYNARLEHKVAATTTGTISNRRITVLPCT